MDNSEIFRKEKANRNNKTNISINNLKFTTKFLLDNIKLNNNKLNHEIKESLSQEINREITALENLENEILNYFEFFEKILNNQTYLNNIIFESDNLTDLNNELNKHIPK